MRTESSIRNLIFAFTGQTIGILISLISRWVFISILSAEYLGLNGLFTNILLVLSLVELGVGPAMNFSLYKPLANNDKDKIKSLMNLYRKIYILVGIAILILGIVLIPALPFFINDLTDIEESITVIYILFVLNTSISYFFLYKRSLLISDQKRYIATAYRYTFYFILNVLQIIILVLTHNYILFLVAQILITLIENVAVSLKTNKLYPYIKEKNISKLEENDSLEIKNNVKAMFLHKVGEVVLLGTDNIIISKFVGLVAVGIYSNYYLIINALNTVIGQIFTSVIASIGNLAITANKDKLYSVFKRIFFLNFWVYSFASICLLVLFNNFILLWAGNDYLFPMIIVCVIVLNFYISGMRMSCLTFRDALGLFWKDRYKPLIEIVINLVLSIVLVQHLGIIGVFIGTSVSTMLTCFWIEPFILYKYGFNENVRKYFIKYIQYTFIFVIVAIITLSLTTLLLPQTTILSFICKMAICTIVPNLLFILLFRNTDEYIFFTNLIKSVFQKVIEKLKITNKQK